MVPSFIVETPSKRRIEIEVYSGFIPKNEIAVDKKFFSELCKKCRNYDKKYSCPPKSPDFPSICQKEGLFIVLFKCDLTQIKNTPEFNKIRIANSIMKSRIDKLMRKLETDFNNKLKFLSSGSCRLCKKCNLEKNLPCKYPQKMRFSLESIGINVEKITRSFLIFLCFGTIQKIITLPGIHV